MKHKGSYFQRARRSFLKVLRGGTPPPPQEHYEITLPFFDEDYYTREYSDVKTSGMDPHTHFLMYGWRELRNPSDQFCTEFYLEKYTDVPFGVNPLIHYIQVGKKEGRLVTRPHISEAEISELNSGNVSEEISSNISVIKEHFDKHYYLENNPDVKQSKVDPIKHYCIHGWKEGRDPAPLFSNTFYISTYKDVAKLNINPFVHYIKYGWKEKRDPSADFSTSFYLESNKDIKEAGLNPLTHYLRHGKREGRSPKKPIDFDIDDYSLEDEMEVVRTEFDVKYYLERNSDVIKAEIDPLTHFCKHGWKENRDPNSTFSCSYYGTQIADKEINPFLHYLVFGRDAGLIPKVIAEPFADCLPTGELRTNNATFSKTIAVMVHMYYVDMASEIEEHLSKIPYSFDLLISTDDKSKVKVIKEAFQEIANCDKIIIEVVENRGRDIAPLIVTFGKTLLNYDYGLHLHTKRSPYGTNTEGWFDFLMDHLLHSPLYIDSIFKQFENSDIGIVAPQYFHSLMHLKHWGVNFDGAKFLMQDLGLEIPSESRELHFPMGSMFWFKTDAIRQLLDNHLTYNNFPKEGGQIDGTISHSIERLFGIVAEINGYSMKIFRPVVGRGSFVPRLVEPYSDPVELPQSDEPLISVVIPVYNQFEYTNACVRAIVEHTDFQETSYEIIIADDCSDDETQEIESFFSNIKRIKPESNLGFLENCNHAIRHAKGDYIFLLNNDTQIQKGTLKYLSAIFEEDSEVAISGAKLIYPDNTLQEAGGIVWSDASGANYGRNDLPSRPEYCYVKEVDYISGAAIMIKKSFWDKVEGFDPQLKPAYYEDTDLCMTARDHGYKVVFQPAAQVVHFEGKSHGTDLESGIKKYQVVNKEKFYKKWKDILSDTHLDHKPLRARERSQGKKIAYVLDYFLPDYDRHCGARHTFQYVKLLQQMGYQVKYLADAISEDRQEVFAKELEQLGIETFYPEGIFRTINWSQLLADRASANDIAIINRPHIAQKYLPILKKHNIRTLLFNHDIHSLRSKRLAKLEDDKNAYEQALKEEEHEKHIYSQVDHIVTPSSFEADYVRENWGIKSIDNIPLYIEPPTKFKPKRIKKDNALLFVGGMRHRPNEQGIKWFVFDVLPLIKKRVDNLVIHIVGTGCPIEIKDLEDDCIKLHNGISDSELFELYQRSKASIVPLHSGAGVKGKVIESLFYGVPVISTSIGLEGISGLDEIYPPCDSVDDFAKAAVEILNSKVDITDSKGIDRILKDSFSSEAGRKILEPILDNLLCDI